MKQQFDKKLRLYHANRQRLTVINSILEEYKADGFVLTLRQLYYQLVSRDIIPNKIEEYERLSMLLKKGRMAGVVDWAAIEDRVRKPKLPYWVEGPDDAVNDMIKQYRLDRMAGQDQQIEVWIEKDALSSILWRVTSKYHVNLMVNRGYSSVSAMYDAYQRLNHGDIILYFGDHDPSGLDMVRDVKDRLNEFGLDIDVRPIALTYAQVELYNPPPNPAKFEDPRAKDYIAEFGEISWELDALPPRDLMTMCEDAIKENINLRLWQSQVDQEQIDIADMKRKFGLS